MAAALFAPPVSPPYTPFSDSLRRPPPVPYAAFSPIPRLRRPLPVGLQLAFCLNIVCVTP